MSLGERKVSVKADLFQEAQAIGEMPGKWFLIQGSVGEPQQDNAERGPEVPQMWPQSRPEGTWELVRGHPGTQLSLCTQLSLDYSSEDGVRQISKDCFGKYK